MRTREHLVYTPAPDIIHESAGHAPILPEPAYAAYLRRIGEVGKLAFTVPAEERVFQASYLLSEVKEDPSANPASVRRVEAELADAVAAVPEDSEAAWLSRLYWWTAEYGLIGRTDEYRMFGAGLLSSLGESHSCHSPSVKKLPLDEACIDVGYDITRPQPQLFVARSFEHLHEVLERVSQRLAVNVGGKVALERALRSGELASLRFSSGAWAMGVVREAGPGAAWLRLGGPVGFAWDGRIHDAQRSLRPAEQWLVTGRLASGAPLEALTERSLSALVDGAGRTTFSFENGAGVWGRLRRVVRGDGHRLLHVELADVRLELPGIAPLELPTFALVPLGDFVTAHAGAVDPAFHAETEFSGIRVPKPRARSESERALLGLYERVAAAPRTAVAVDELVQVHAALDQSYPREWLLRWNLLERLRSLPAARELTSRIAAELEALEVAHERKEPIAMGLKYLSEPPRG
jgi:phenylalanine-4-hydroxylase